MLGVQGRLRVSNVPKQRISAENIGTFTFLEGSRLLKVNLNPLRFTLS